MTPSDAIPPARWYLAQTKPNAHRIALRNLVRQGFETFLPLQRLTRRSGGRFVSREVPLFPGYLFVTFATGQRRWHAINNTQGITRLVSFGAEPAHVPLGLVEGLRKRCDEDGVLRDRGLPEHGDAVRLLSGPLADFVARVEEITPERRVWVVLEMMGQPLRVALDAEDIGLV